MEKIKETIFKYDIEKYDFKSLVEKIYLSKLDQIHNISEEDYNAVQHLGKDSDTIFHKVFYNKLREGWPEIKELYKKFIEEIILPIIGEDKLIYQKFPTYRVHLPNNKVVSLWHCDGDENHLHPKEEINFVLPLTKAYDTNTIWVESEPDLVDFHPVNMEYGEFLMFHGNKCTHGNKLNTTGKTRVSFDFRVIPGSKYNHGYNIKTITKGLTYKVGEYYDIIEK